MTFFGFEFEVTLLASLFFYFCFAISLYFYAQPAKLDMLKGSVIFFVGNGLYAIAMGSLIVAAISVVIISYALLKYMQFSNILKLSKAQDIACLLVVSAIGIIAGYKVPLDLIVVLAFVLGRVGEFVPSPKLNKVLYVIAGLLYVGFALGDGMMEWRLQMRCLS